MDYKILLFFLLNTCPHLSKGLLGHHFLPSFCYFLHSVASTWYALGCSGSLHKLSLLSRAHLCCLHPPNAPSACRSGPPPYFSKHNRYNKSYSKINLVLWPAGKWEGCVRSTPHDSVTIYVKCSLRTTSRGLRPHTLWPLRMLLPNSRGGELLSWRPLSLSPRGQWR